MNFTQIYNGMVGRDFIKAFNDNFIIADTNLVDILATLIYKVKSTDIKEFKVINDVVSYTLEEAPEDGEEDTREWIPVDITKWGNINGNIEDQTDIWNILEDKAAVETVETLSNLLSTLSSNYEQTRTQVETNTASIRTNTGDIANLLEVITEKVNSTNIKAIRLNNAVFQWSPDGRTWYEQPIVTSIAWGHLTGDITTQTDLMAYFTNIQNQFTAMDGSVTAIQNDITALSNELDTLTTSFETHLTDFDNYKNEVRDRLSEIRGIANQSSEKADNVESDLEEHLLDYNNPHHVSKDTVSLGNVDNTADIDKPLSTAQKRYVDNQINSVMQDIADANGLIAAQGLSNAVFVGTNNDYALLDSKIGVLAFIVDENYITTNVILTSELFSNFGLYVGDTALIPTTTTQGTKYYTDVSRSSSDFSIHVDVDGEEKVIIVLLDFNKQNVFSIDEMIVNDEEPGNNGESGNNEEPGNNEEESGE